MLLKRHTSTLPAISLLDEYCVSIVASVAKDGVAPELRQEGALREERYSCSTTRVYRLWINALALIKEKVPGLG